MQSYKIHDENEDILAFEKMFNKIKTILGPDGNQDGDSELPKIGPLLVDLIKSIEKKEPPLVEEILLKLESIFTRNGAVYDDIFLIFRIPAHLMECLQTDAPQNVLFAAIKFLIAVFNTKNQEYINQLFEEKLPEHLTPLLGVINVDIIESYLTLLAKMILARKNNIDFILEIITEDIFKEHINDSPEIQTLLCSILYAFTYTSQKKELRDTIIITISEICYNVNEEAAYRLIGTLIRTGTVSYSETWLSMIIDLNLVEFGMQFIENENNDKVEMSINFLSTLCIHEYELSNAELSKLEYLLKIDDEDKNSLALCALYDQAYISDTYAVKFASDKNLVDFSINILEQGQYREKFNAAKFLCALMKNCGPEFIYSISDREWISELVEMFISGKDKDYCITFAESFYAALRRVKGSDLFQRYLQEFDEAGGIEAFNDCQFEDGELPNYTESFLAEFIDDEREESGD